MKFLNRSLGRKLALAVGLPLAALATVAGLGIVQLQSAGHRVAEIGEEDLPMAVAAGRVDGTLLHEAVAFETALRAIEALQRGDDARAALADATAGFERHAKSSDADFTRLRQLTREATEGSDAADAARYAELARGVDAMDAAQTDFERRAAALFALAAAGRHDEALRQAPEVGAAGRQAEAAIGGYIAAVETLTKDNVADALAGARRAEWLQLAIALAGWLAAAAIGTAVARGVLRQARDAQRGAERIADGDLTGELALRSDDEMGRMVAAMRRMQAALVAVVGEVRGHAESVATASTQIAHGNTDLSQRTEEQASALQQTAATMEELGTTATRNSESASQASQLAQSASEVAKQGGQVVAQVVETMRGISDDSRRIAEITSVVDGIAFQTNILALNAAVEAARAGEQGRGFAVVAGEVRALAQRSAEASKQIRALIAASAERVERGGGLVEGAGRTMDEVVASIRRVDDIVAEIAVASREQGTGVGQIGEAVSQMDQVTQQNAALVEESAAAAESLAHQADALVKAVAVFRLPGHAPARPAFEAVAEPARSAIGTGGAPGRPAPRPARPAVIAKPAHARGGTSPAAPAPRAAPVVTAAPAPRVAPVGTAAPAANRVKRAEVATTADDDWTTF